MPTYIKLTFQDDNPLGANDNDGWRVYRNIGSDPCPGGVIDPAKKVHEDMTPIPGIGPVEYIDTNVSANNPYFYRASFLRSGVEAINTIGAVGPILLGDINDLGYPNSLPSDASGVAFTSNIEPLYHLDSQKEKNIRGIGHLYTTSDTTNNRPGSYPELDGFHMGPGNVLATTKANHLIAWDSPNNPTGTTIPVLTDDPSGNGVHYWAEKFLPIASSINYLIGDQSLSYQNSLVFDQGTTCIDVVMPVLHNTAYGGVYKTWSSNASALYQGECYPNGTYPAYLWSDILAQGVGNLTGSSTGTAHALGYEANITVAAQALGARIQGYNKISGFRGYNLAVGGFPAVSLPANFEDGDLNVLVSRILPDGSQKVWCNGAKVIDNAPSTYPDGVGGTATPMPTAICGVGSFGYTYGMCSRAEGMMFPGALDNLDLQKVIAYINGRYAGYITTPGTYAGM